MVRKSRQGPREARGGERVPLGAHRPRPLSRAAQAAALRAVTRSSARPSSHLRETKDGEETEAAGTGLLSGLHEPSVVMQPAAPGSLWLPDVPFGPRVGAGDRLRTVSRPTEVHGPGRGAQPLPGRGRRTVYMNPQVTEWVGPLGAGVAVS